MDSILSELKPEDIFSIVEFNFHVKVWNISSTNSYYTDESDEEQSFNNQSLSASFPATVDNIANAKQVLNKKK